MSNSSLDANFRSVSEPLPYSAITNLGSKAADCPHILNIITVGIRLLTEISTLRFHREIVVEARNNY